MNEDAVNEAQVLGCLNAIAIPLAEKYQLIGYLVDQGFTLRKIKSMKSPLALDMVRSAMKYAIYMNDKQRASVPRPFKNELVSVRVVGGPSLSAWDSVDGVGND